jgi:hypothetical protein
MLYGALFVLRWRGSDGSKESLKRRVHADPERGGGQITLFSGEEARPRRPRLFGLGGVENKGAYLIYLKPLKDFG